MNWKGSLFGGDEQKKSGWIKNNRKFHWSSIAKKSPCENPL
jgi:hypothetical protein